MTCDRRRDMLYELGEHLSSLQDTTTTGPSDAYHRHKGLLRMTRDSHLIDDIFHHHRCCRWLLHGLQDPASSEEQDRKLCAVCYCATYLVSTSPCIVLPMPRHSAALCHDNQEVVDRTIPASVTRTPARLRCHKPGAYYWWTLACAEFLAPGT